MAKIALSKTEIDLSASAVILGCPASGKTRTLVELIQALEQAGATPEQILVLTPSRLAANSLRDEIGAISALASSEPRARSMASFAFSLLVKQDPDAKLLSGAAQQALIADLISKSVSKKRHLVWGFDKATCELKGFQTELRDLLAVVIENQLTTEQLTKLQDKFPKTKLQIAIDLLPEYHSALSQLQALDPSALLSKALSVLETLDSVRYLVVDDAQDLSPAGLKLIAQLENRTTSYIFGDPDAAVLGFRSGGESFLSYFPELPRISLTQPDFAASKLGLLQKISSRIPTSLAIEHRPRTIEQHQLSAEFFDNQAAESDWLAAQLRRAKLLEGLNWSDMAVIARTRTQLDQLANDLSARIVPVRIIGVQKALREHFAARAILDFGALVYGLEKHVDSEAILRSPLAALDSLGLRRLFRELSQHSQFQNRSRTQIAGELFDELIEGESFELKALNRITQARFEIANRKEISAYEFVSLAAELINLKRLKTLSKSSGEVALAATRDLDSLLELFAAAQRFDLREKSGARGFVENQLELSIPEDSLAPIGLRPAVTLATSAQLPGKHFELVALPRLQEGIWPNLRPRTSLLGASSLQAFLAGRSDSPETPAGSELADEIRAFYKAVGAHKSKLLLTAMDAHEEQPSQFFTMFGIEGSKNTEPIDFDIRRQVGRLRSRAMANDKTAIATLATLSLAGVPGAHPRNWQGLHDATTSEPVVSEGEQLRLSASKLEAFEKCPLHWFIGTFGGESASFQASLGTLMHAALEASSQGVALSDFVQSNWHTLEFESKWQELAQLRKSARMISLITEYLSKSGELVSAEQSFELRVGNLTVAGKIDRVERAAEGLVVVDLKTGKPQSAAEVIENRQLSVYQLALRSAGEKVAGARIVAVGDPKLKVMEQPALDASMEVELKELFEAAANQIGSEQFAASYSSHCSQDGNCQLLLAKAVQHD